MSMTDDDEAAPDDIVALLPWYANGRLPAQDMHRVEQALARDPRLGRQYDLVREEMTATIHLNETLGSPSAQAMDRLFDAIDQEPARPRRLGRGFATRLAGLLAELSPRTLAWSVSITAVALLVQGGVIAALSFGPRPGLYRTASAPSGDVASGSYALIAFKPTLPAAEVTALLQRNKVTISGGPFPGGLYRVRLGAADMALVDRRRVIDALQSDPGVGFVSETD